MDIFLDTDKAVLILSESEGAQSLLLVNNSGNTVFIDEFEERATADLGIIIPSSPTPIAMGIWQGNLWARASVTGTRIKMLKSAPVVIPSGDV